MELGEYLKFFLGEMSDEAVKREISIKNTWSFLLSGIPFRRDFRRRTATC